MSTNSSDSVPNGPMDEIDGAHCSCNHESEDISEENKRMKMDTNKETRQTTPLPTTSYQSRENSEIDDESSQVSPHQPHAITKALHNSLVLREILRSFSTVELFRLRQVNTLWRDCASSILRRRRDNTLWFAYDPDCKSYKLSSDSVYIVQDEEGQDYSLKNLLCLFAEVEEYSSSNPSALSSFPCGHFKFAEGSLIHKEIQEVLRFCGKNMRGLTLDDIFITTVNYDSDDEEMEEEEEEEVNFDLQPLRILLLEQAPNIEFLQISRSFQIPTYFPLFQKNLPPPTLPNLRTLKINKVTSPESMQLVKELLDTAINIQNVEVEENYKLQALEWFYSINRLDLIHDFHFRVDDPENHPLGKVANFPLRLKRIEISVKCHIDSSHVDEEFRERENRNLRYLAKILSSCQNSLEVLRVNNPGLYGLVPGLEWPASNSTENENEDNNCWKNLKRLELYIHAYTSRCRSDESFRRELVSFRQLFPNLSIVRIEGKGRDIFASHEVLSQVTRLEILEGYNTMSFMESMIHAFPNIEHLGLSRVRRLVDFGEVIWKFPELKTLELELLLDGRDKYDDYDQRQAITNRYPNLDVVFAGFSHASVQELISKRKRDVEFYGLPKHPHEIPMESLTLIDEDLETLRTRPCIVNCQKLRKLDIAFYDGVSSTRRRAHVKFDLMSEICDRYGFRFLPNLEVIVSIKQNDHPTDPYDNTDTDSEPNSEVLLDSDEICSSTLTNPNDYSYDHDVYIKKIENALIPISKFPNVRIVEAKYHDMSILRT